ncbi:spore-associated protein [Streptomyces sp.]|uniref:spore-associated protein n=1 Tax=Streptomyces sp. TaxID=1931 RepID=UPI00281120C7|nr:spore-associated protein [Streptomyces sp.]
MSIAGEQMIFTFASPVKTKDVSSVLRSRIKAAALVGAVAAAGLFATATPASAVAAPTPGAVCGSGYKVINSKDLGPAVVYLTYNSSNGYNCVTTIQENPSAPGVIWMGASIQKSGGSEIRDFGNYGVYAGPVYVHAPDTCIKWGGGMYDYVWRSGWEHCG